MKLWKYILGALTFIGGLLVVNSSKKTKEIKKKVETNKKEIKQVKTKAKKVEAKKVEAKKAIKDQDKKVAKTKAKVKKNYYG